MTLIEQACRLLQQGGLVAFPTETVYGLGADATNTVAVQRIFDVKGRPATNPLIVHVADVNAAKRYTTGWNENAAKLATHFWPGPLTLVLPKADAIVPRATAGRSTVGLRVPNHPMALELLRQFEGAVAAPSANRSNHVSPTDAQHVHQELGDAVDLILDGGPCDVGIESTVVDLCTDHPTILRPGGVTREEIESLIGPVKIFCGSFNTNRSAASPGQFEKHYSPATPTFRFEKEQRAEVLQTLGNQGQHFVLLISGQMQSHQGIETAEMPENAPEYAAKLYATLRRLDVSGYARIIIEMPPDSPPWVAVRDRLMRASQPV